MPPEETQSALERARQQLYSPTATPHVEEPLLSPRLSALNERWKEEPLPPPAPPKKRLSWAVWFLIVAGIFCVLAAGLSFFFLASGSRNVSNDKLDITVQGPTTIASGTAVPLVVTINNRNPAEITHTSLDVDFPDGTRSADDISAPLDRFDGSIGSVGANTSKAQTVQAVFFGSVNQTITVPITLTYQTDNSNATFTKKQTYTFTITSAPLTITAQTVPSVSPGQPFAITVAVRSNATQPLTNIAVLPTYPTGFIPTTSGSTKGSLYQIGNLAPGQEQDITIAGTLSGVASTSAGFQFMVGTQNPDGTNALSVAYASAGVQIVLQKPFLSSVLILNGTNDGSKPLVTMAGQPVGGSVSWTNTLAQTLTNAQVSVKISGAALDPTSIVTQNGFYDSSTQTIRFTSQTNSSLSSLAPGATGSGSFTFASKTGAALNAVQNPTVQVAVSVTGTANGRAQTISNTVTRTVQVATSVGLTSKILHSTGPFTNSGPWPPKAGSPTTYTVQLAIANTANPVGGGMVTMILPTYVTYTGQVTPTDGSITYDDSSRTVTWKVGNIPVGAGVSGAPLTAAFQISFTPSTSQVGGSPVLVGSQELTGTDRFTSAHVDTTANALTTQAPADPAYTPAFGNVGS